MGGVGPYLAFATSNPEFVTVPSGTFNGPEFTVTVAKVPTNNITVAITIYDSRGESSQVSLVLDVLPTLPLSVTPEKITLSGFANLDSDITDDVTLYIAGGTPPYSMFSSNSLLIASQGALGPDVNNFKIDPESVDADTDVILTVEDSAGATDTATVTLTPKETALGLNQSEISVTAGTDVLFYIIGGTPNYSAFTSDGSIATVNGGNSASLATVTTFTVHAVSAGKATITATDGTGKTATATITVTTQAGEPIKVLPSAQTVNGAPGGTATFKIFGGLPPYEIFTSNPLFQPVPNPVPAIGDTFSVTVPPNTLATSVTYTIRDSVGNSGGPVTLTITSIVTDFYALPEAATFSVGGSMTFTIFGGNDPFEFFVDNNELVWILYDATIDPRSFTVIGLASGTVTVTIRDEDGRQKTVDVTIQ
jgi:hypothetical protein